MAFTEKPTDKPEAEKPHPPKTQNPAQDWPTRDGQPFGDPLPEGVDPKDYVDPNQGATPQNVTKNDPRKNMSQDAIEASEGKVHKAKDGEQADIDPRSANHPAKHQND